MKRLFSLLGVLLGVVTYLALGWVAGLVVLVVALVGTVLSLRRELREFAPERTCPRGHRVPTYGLFHCASCGWTGEGLVWRCRHCGARYGHTPCPTCGLSVSNPSL